MIAWLIAAALVYTVLRIAFRHEIRAARERDPAATSSIEVLLTYSGVHALIFHRVARALRLLRVPILPRMIMSLARWLTGIEIHPGARIGPGLFIDHGMGVVIGETATLGEQVTLFQGVTLGGTGKERGKRHPDIGNHVVVGAGAKVLGNIKVGDYCVIGANAVVIRDVPQHCTVVGVPGHIARNRGDAEDLAHTRLPDPIAVRLRHLQREIAVLNSQILGHQQDEPAKPPEPEAEPPEEADLL